jgi:cytidylate kinase
VIAPFELRVKRVMKKMAGQAQEGVDVRTTVEMVRHSDQEKHGRIRYLYDVDCSDPRCTTSSSTLRSSRSTRASRCWPGSSELW